MVRYGNRNNLNFSIEQFNQNNLIFRDSFQIEAMVEYLIQLGDQHKLNLAQILNHKAKNGTTLILHGIFLLGKICQDIDTEKYQSQHGGSKIHDTRIKVSTVIDF